MLIAIFLSPALVQAATWTVDLAFIGSLSTVKGTYDYDSVGDVYSAVAVQATGEQFLPNPSHYNAVWGDPWSTNSQLDMYIVGDMNGLRATVMYLASAMTETAGSVIAITELRTWLCEDSACDAFGSDVQYFYDTDFNGTVSTPSAVPLPAAAWLFGSGLLGLIGVSRRKKLKASPQAA
jgi:hypothetical protein